MVTQEKAASPVGVYLLPELETLIREKYLVGAQNILYRIECEAQRAWAFFTELLDGEEPIFPVPVRIEYDHDEWDFIVRKGSDGLVVTLFSDG